MAYADNHKASPAGLIAAITVQAAIGVAVITGLSVTANVVKNGNIVEVWDIPVEPPPPTPPPSEHKQKTGSNPAITPHITAPRTRSDVNDNVSEFHVVDPGPVPISSPTPGSTQTKPLAALTPSGFDPVKAKPRNDPGAWFSDRDYKSSWARRDLTGTASFRLDIAANGTITNCQIIRSAGYKELDAATCALISRRAKFEPARGRSGEAVTGSYTGSVHWKLPD